MPGPAWTLRPATPADLPFLLALRLATMAGHFERQGIAQSEDEHRLRVERRFDAACVVVCDGTDAGLLKLVREAPTWTLEQIQLLPAYQGRGLGRAILAAVIAEARAAAMPLQLGVLKANPARRLYERLGFAVSAESATGFTMTLGERPVG